MVAAPISRRTFLGAVGLAGAATAIARGAQGSTEVIEQSADSGACAPCALGNALLRGDAAGRRAFNALPGANIGQQIDALIARYGARPSETYGKARGRFVAGAGLPTEDMPHLVNDLLRDAGLPETRGEWLDNTNNEEQRTHLQRIHRVLTASLSRGFPPIVEVRSFSAESASGRLNWINLYAHWLAIVAADPLDANDSGFACKLADSFTGRLVNGFIYEERFRTFQATRGFTVRPNGAKDWHWLSGHPFALINLPDIPLAIEGRPPQDRAVVALSYAVMRGS